MREVVGFQVLAGEGGHFGVDLQRDEFAAAVGLQRGCDVGGGPAGFRAGFQAGDGFEHQNQGVEEKSLLDAGGAAAPVPLVIELSTGQFGMHVPPLGHGAKQAGERVGALGAVHAGAGSHLFDHDLHGVVGRDLRQRHAAVRLFAGLPGHPAGGAAQVVAGSAGSVPVQAVDAAAGVQADLPRERPKQPHAGNAQRCRRVREPRVRTDPAVHEAKHGQCLAQVQVGRRQPDHAVVVEALNGAEFRLFAKQEHDARRVAVQDEGGGLLTELKRPGAGVMPGAEADAIEFLAGVLAWKLFLGGHKAVTGHAEQRSRGHKIIEAQRMSKELGGELGVIPLDHALQRNDGVVGGHIGHFRRVIQPLEPLQRRVGHGGAVALKRAQGELSLRVTLQQGRQRRREKQQVTDPAAADDQHPPRRGVERWVEALLLPCLRLFVFDEVGGNGVVVEVAFTGGESERIVRDGEE